MRLPGRIKLKGFEFFERPREEFDGGGGVAVIVKEDLNPVWVGEGEGQVEAISVNIKTKNKSIRVCSAYGPQNKEEADLKEKFWEYLDKDAKSADKSGSSYYLQMDGNMNAGEELIPGDTRPQNNNGKRLQQFLENNSNLVILNSLDLCEGLITRRKITRDRIEEGVLDVVIISEDLIKNVKKMKIDEAREHPLTTHRKKKQKVNDGDTDHFTIEVDMNLKIPEVKNNIKMFNFKDDEAMIKFKEMTTDTSDLTECFVGEESLNYKIHKWKNTLRLMMSKCFKTLKIKRKMIKKPKQSNLLRKRNMKKIDLNQIMSKCSNCFEDENSDKNAIMKEAVSEATIVNSIQDAQTISCQKCGKDIKEKLSKTHIEKVHEVENELKELNNQITEVSMKETEDNFKKLHAKYKNGANESIDLKAIWKEFNGVVNNNKKAANTAKINHKGKLLTDINSINEALAKEMSGRMRKRPVNLKAKALEELDMALSNKVLEDAAKRKTPDWKIEDLRRVLKNLKTSKARDAEGLSNHIFKYDNIGSNLEQSMLMMFNMMKSEGYVPMFMNRVNVACVPKKGSRLVLKNDRGIYLVSKIRSILMRMIYNSNYDVMDSNMTDKNVGSRKGLSSLNNIFIICSIINDIRKSKTKMAVNLQILDYAQMFDSVQLRKGIIGLNNIGLNNDQLTLYYKANEAVLMTIKNGGSLSQVRKLFQIVMQGDTLAPMTATSKMADLAEEWDSMEEEALFQYKEEVPIGVLGMVDDNIGVAEVGHKTVLLNAYLNAKTSEVGLQYGVDKCKIMTVKHKDAINLDDEAMIEEWEAKYDNEDQLIDELKGMKSMKKVESAKYLGVVIQSNGLNDKTIEAKCKIAIGNINRTLDKLKHLRLGNLYFKIVLQMKEAMIVSSLMYGTEVLPNMRKEDVEKLAKKDHEYLKKAVETMQSCPTALLNLEFGNIPIPVQLMMRRVMYLQYILKMKEDSLLKRVFMAQRSKPVRGDWADKVQEDMTKLNIKLSDSEIAELSKEKLRKIVKERVKVYALEMLNSEKERLVKGKENKYVDLKPQEYLTAPSVVSVSDRRNIFMMRTNMEMIATNFSYKFPSKNCQLGCEDELETRSHIVICPRNNEDESHLNIDVFQGADIELMASVANKILDIIDKRKTQVELGVLSKKNDNLLANTREVLQIKRKKIGSKWSQKLSQKVNPVCVLRGVSKEKKTSKVRRITIKNDTKMKMTPK